MAGSIKTLIIGFGSIGKRHAEILSSLGHEVFIVTQQKNIRPFETYTDISMALKTVKPNYVVIASETARHEKDLNKILDSAYKGPVLIEKPLFSKPLLKNKAPQIPLYVGYNLRFLPMISKLKSLLKKEGIISCNLYCGQYLPLWRRGRAYPRSYSAHKNLGGGVIRDLSHELDLLLWLFGPWKSVVSKGGHYSNLAGDSDDVYSALITTENCPLVTLHLNYLDRIVKREIIIQTNAKTIHCDLISGSLKINGSLQNLKVGRNETYQTMHKKVLSKKTTDVCSYDQGLNVVNLIAQMEKSDRTKKWIKNPTGSPSR